MSIEIGRTMTIEAVEAEVQLNAERRRARERLARIVYPFVTIASVILAWEALIFLFGIPNFLLPRPGVVAHSLIANFEILLSAGWVTAVEIVLGYGLSILVGVPLALAIFMWPVFERSVFPLLVSSQAMPKVAVAPLLIVWFGFGLLPKVLIAFLVAFFPIVINTVAGLASIEKEKILLAKAMGLSPWRMFWVIRLPNALPSIFAGLKISITLAVVGAVVAEFVGGNAGLGYQLMIANGSLDTPLLFAGLFALTLLGVICFTGVELVEIWVIPSNRKTERGQARESM